MNFVEVLASYFQDKKKFDYLYLAIGFFLFIGCDICVGLANLGHEICYNLSWVFYAPSQLMIASSFVVGKILENS